MVILLHIDRVQWIIDAVHPSGETMNRTRIAVGIVMPLATALVSMAAVQLGATRSIFLPSVAQPYESVSVSVPSIMPSGAPTGLLPSPLERPGLTRAGARFVLELVGEGLPGLQFGQAAGLIGKGIASLDVNGNGLDDNEAPSLDLQTLILLDTNRDNSLSSDEAMGAASILFSQFDGRSNSVIDEAEMQKLKDYALQADFVPPNRGYRAWKGESAQRRRNRINELPCDIPVPIDGEMVVFYGSVESPQLSTVFVGDEDEETGVIEIDVQPTKEHIYLVLNSDQQMIWNMSGSVDAVSRVVLVGGPAAGVIGVPADRIYEAHDECIETGVLAEHQHGFGFKGQLEGMLGMAVDHSMYGLSTTAASLPAMRSFGGSPPSTIELDPRMIMSASHVAKYSKD